MTNQEHATETGPSARERIESALDAIRPALHIDGGDVEFVDYDVTGGVVRLRLVGACGSCPISSMTLKHGIERRIKLAAPEVTTVLAV